MIPKIIQIHWFWDHWPVWVQQTIDTYREMMPDWDIRVYTEIPKDLPDTYKNIMEQAPHSRFRADLIRWWLLYRDGGVYVDADTRPCCDFDALRSKKPFFATIKPRDIDIFWVGAAPGNQLFMDALEGCKQWRQGPRPDTFFYIANVIPNILSRDIHVFPVDYVYHTTPAETQKLCRGCKIKLQTDAYMVHFRNFGNRIRQDDEGLLKEQKDPSFVQKFPQGIPAANNKIENTQPVAFHTMPNGDLVCDPGGPRPEKTPDGYVQDGEQWFRFHPKPKQSLSATVQQGAVKRRNCPTCKNRGVE